ncbi:MAG: hypothetical protein ACR2MP_05940, partial [Streptosporangiaceae bacterium]
MSQPRPDASWSRGRPGPSHSGTSRSTANPWSPERIEVTAAGRPWEAAEAPADPAPDAEWLPDDAEHAAGGRGGAGGGAEGEEGRGGGGRAGR